MVRFLFIAGLVSVLGACGKNDAGKQAGQAVVEHIEQPKAKAREAVKRQEQAAEEARRQIDEANQ